MLIYPVPCGFIHIHETLIIIPCFQKYLPCSVASYTSMNSVGEVPRKGPSSTGEHAAKEEDKH